MIRLLIADDHMLFRLGLKQWLAREPDIDVVAEAASPTEVIECLHRHCVDVAVLDLSMQCCGDGIELIRRVTAAWPKLAVLVLSMHSHEQYAARALKAGASGYITKDCAAEHVVAAIHRLALGGEYISQNIAERLALQFTRRGEPGLPHACLSEREYQIFELFVQGKTGTQIATELALSKKTVSTHKVRLLRKMNLRNDFELVHYAIGHRHVLSSQFEFPGAATGGSA